MHHLLVPRINANIASVSVVSTTLRLHRGTRPDLSLSLSLSLSDFSLMLETALFADGSGFHVTARAPGDSLFVNWRD